MAFKALILASTLVAFALATEEQKQTEESGRLIFPDTNFQLTVGYSSFMATFAIILIGILVASLVNFFVRAHDSSAYDLTGTYAGDKDYTAYDRVYNVLNTIKEAARKFE